MRRKLLSLLLVLSVSGIASASGQTAKFGYTFWSGMNWYGLYSAYGEGGAEQEEAVRRAVLALRKGEQAALAELKPIVGAGCTDPVVLLMYGYLLHQRGDNKTAADVLQRGATAAAQPDRPEWVRTWVRGACLQWQAYIALSQNRQVEALDLARAALEAYPPCREKTELTKNISALEWAAEAKQEAENALAEAAATPGADGARKVLEVLAAEAKRKWSPYDILPGTANGHRADDWLNHHKWMDFAKALPASEKALAQWPDDPEVVRMHHFILWKLKKWREAEEFGAKRAIPIAEKSDDKERLFWVLCSQVWLVWDDDHADRTPGNSKRLMAYNGTELADRAVAIAEELKRDNLLFRAYMMYAAWVEHSLAGHQWDKAMEFYKKALAVSEKNGWIDRASDAMGGVAEVLACIDRLDESVEWSRKAGRGPHPFVAIRRKRWQEMYERRASIEHYERETLRQPNERLQREVIGWNQRGPYDSTIIASMYLGKPQEAVETVERLNNRTIGMILGAKSEEGRSASIAQRKRQQTDVKQKMDQLGMQLAAAQKQADSASVASIQRDLKVQGAVLAQLDSDIAVDELEVKAAGIPPPMKVGEMQALLDDNSALVVYGVTWEPFINEGVIATLTRDDFKAVLQGALIIGTYEKQGLQPHIDPYVALIAKPTRTPEEEAELKQRNDYLYKLLIAPMRANIENRRHWTVIPSGPLCQVPIHLLRGPDGRHLFESHSISYVASVGVLKYALARNRNVGGDVTVVANPALAAAGASLKFAETEAQEIGKVFPTANLLLGDRATETAVKTALSSADVLHFACHGLLDVDFPMKSSLALTPDAENDGLLTAREICDYPVKAGLVVLSACQSGSGGMSAGWIELVGMSRAWLLAGAPSVMVAQWKLDDRSTSELMAEFYKNLKTMSRAEALQRAQIEMMKKYDNPYYWGAFALYGDYR